MEVIQAKSAQNELKNVYEFISLDSRINAQKVVEALVKITLDLPNHPTKFPHDKYKKNNQGDWRAFEKFSFRVSYRITPN